MGPLLGVNQLWNDHAPENECVFLKYMLKKGKFGQKKPQIILG